MKRRYLLTSMAATTLSSGIARAQQPFGGRAQQPAKIARVGFLSGVPNNPMIVAADKAFSDEMRKLG